MQEPTFFPTEAEFRRWLQANHQTAPELLVGFWKKASLERLLRLLPLHGPPRFILAISDRLKVDEDALQEIQGPVLRFKEIPNASELANLLGTFVGGRAEPETPLFG